jgi:hypothetical protein
VNDLDAGIADQHVDAAEGRHHFGDRRVHLFFAGDVHGHADRRARRP